MFLLPNSVLLSYDIDSLWIITGAKCIQFQPLPHAIFNNITAIVAYLTSIVKYLFKRQVSGSTVDNAFKCLLVNGQRQQLARKIALRFWARISWLGFVSLIKLRHWHPLRDRNCFVSKENLHSKLMHLKGGSRGGPMNEGDLLLLLTSAADAGT